MLQKLITVLVGYVLLIYVCLVRLPFERKKKHLLSYHAIPMQKVKLRQLARKFQGKIVWKCCAFTENRGVSLAGQLRKLRKTLSIPNLPMKSKAENLCSV